MKIAQLSDFHLRHHLPGSSQYTERQCRYINKLLPRALDLIAAEKPDLMVITGDLVDVSDTLIEQAAVTPEMVADYQLVKQILDSIDIPYVPLPGNHDYEPAFWEVFDREQNDITIAGHRVIRFCDREHENHFPKRVDEERDLFNQVLSDTDLTPQVHLQHYLVTPTLNDSYPHTYTDGPGLVEQITQSKINVPLCLSGHYHYGVEPADVNGTTFITCPAFCVSPFVWQMHSIDGGEVVTRQCNLLDG